MDFLDNWTDHKIGILREMKKKAELISQFINCKNAYFMHFLNRHSMRKNGRMFSRNKLNF